MEILIVGGGYVGMYTARRLERLLRRSEATVTVVEPRGCMTYQPLLAEAASGSVEPRATGPTTSSTQAKAMKKPRALRHLGLALCNRTDVRKTGGAKGIRTPDLLHAMQHGFV